jgi:hypothetical protein
MGAVPALLAILFHLGGTVEAAGEFQPLPPWYFSGDGTNFTWDGSSTGPDNAELSVTVYEPKISEQYGNARATGSTNLLQIAPATTYTFTFSAVLGGSLSGNAGMVSVYDDNILIKSTWILSPPPFTWNRYTNSFTTDGPDDPRVGRNLNVVLLVSRFSNPGTTTASFTNIQFEVSTTRPRLSHHLVAPGQLQLLWPTNFYWYVLEQTSNLQTASWVETTNLPVVVGNQFQIEIDTMIGRKFFRLKQP